MKRFVIIAGVSLGIAFLAACGGGSNNFSAPTTASSVARQFAFPPMAPGIDLPQPFLSRSAPRGKLHGVKKDTGVETVLYSFAGGSSDGMVPANQVLLPLNGTFYAETRGGGGTGCNGAGCGTVFTTSPSGGESVLYSFQGGGDGNYPKGGLVERKGVLYGTTQGGGYYGGGTFFKLTTSGKHTVLYSFGAGSGTQYDGYFPYGRLIYVSATDTFYGTTLSGGNSACQCGTVFSMSASGKEALLHSFTGAPDGNFLAGSLLYKSGYLYGTTELGGNAGASVCTSSTAVVGCGTIFGVKTSGKDEKILYNFTGSTDGAFPDAGLIEVKGKMYGMSGGGFTPSGCAPNCGTVFSVTTKGAFHTIYTFKGPPNDGAGEFGNLTDVKGILYGATQYGGNGKCAGFSGVPGCGIVFSVTKSGKEKVLYSFQGSPDGNVAQTTLLNSGSLLYGTTDFGGTGCTSTGGCGTIFSIMP